MTKKRDDAEQQAFDLGRHARGVAIGRDQSPLTGPLRAIWQEGWDAEDQLRESDAEQEARVAKAKAAQEKAEAAAAKKAAEESAADKQTKKKA